MSSRSDAKNLAKLWLEAPDIMADDLRKVVVWLQQNALTSIPSSGRSNEQEMHVISSVAALAVERLEPLDMAVYEYGRGQRNSRVPQTLFVPLMMALSDSIESGEDVVFLGFHQLNETIEKLEQWVLVQQRSSQRIGNRSDTLQTTIEQIGDELFVKTDLEGSTRIRGATNIPMFMAFWQAHGHRLSREAFLDLDPNVDEKNLERHRVRLCGKLQDVLLEIVLSGNGYQLRRCKKPS